MACGASSFLNEQELVQHVRTNANIFTARYRGLPCHCQCQTDKDSSSNCPAAQTKQTRVPRNRSIEDSLSGTAFGYQQDEDMHPHLEGHMTWWHSMSSPCAKFMLSMRAGQMSSNGAHSEGQSILLDSPLCAPGQALYSWPLSPGSL